MGAGRARLAGEENDVAHGLHGAQVVGLHRDWQRDQEVEQGKAVAALPAHGGDLDHQFVGALLDRLAAFVDQLATAVGIDRRGEMHDMGSHRSVLRLRVVGFPTREWQMAARVSSFEGHRRGKKS